MNDHDQFLRDNSLPHPTRAGSTITLKVSREFIETASSVFGLSNDDLSAAPDHCRTLLDVYMWKWELPREVAQARMDELAHGIQIDDAARVLRAFAP